MNSKTNHSLIIMRHGKSDWDSGVDRDFDRPLSKRGDREVVKMAGWMAGQALIPDIIVASPAIRARQTAIAVAEACAIAVTGIVWDEAIYDASLGQLLKVIEDHADKHHCMMLIGHNPGLDSLLYYLSTDDPPTSASGKLMTTSAIAILDYNSRPVSAQPQSASLIKLVRPKEIQP